MGFFDKDLIDTGEGAGVVGALQDFGNEIQADLREALNNLGHTKSDKLGSSIVFDIQQEEGGIEFELRMEQYGLFLDEGVQGVGEAGLKGDNHKSYPQHQTSGKYFFKTKKPPIFENSSLSVWAQGLNINPYAARESIFRKGIKQTNWFTNTIQGKVDELKERLSKAGAKEIKLSFSDGKLKGITK